MQVPASLDKTACKGSSVAAQGTVICNLRLTSRISKFRFPLDQVGSKQKNMYSTVTLLATVFFFFFLRMHGACMVGEVYAKL